MCVFFVWMFVWRSQWRKLAQSTPNEVLPNEVRQMKFAKWSFTKGSSPNEFSPNKIFRQKVLQKKGFVIVSFHQKNKILPKQTFIYRVHGFKPNVIWNVCSTLLRNIWMYCYIYIYIDAFAAILFSTKCFTPLKQNPDRIGLYILYVLVDYLTNARLMLKY